MQAVNVLRDDGNELPRALERDDGGMNRIRASVLIGAPALQLEIPILDPRALRGQELVVVHRTAARPDTVRTSEIWNAAGRRYTGPGEDHDAPRCPKPFDQTCVDRRLNAPGLPQRLTASRFAIACPIAGTSGSPDGARRRYVRQASMAFRAISGLMPDRPL